MATIAVVGLDKVKSRFADIARTAPAKVDAEIQMAGLRCQGLAKQLAPVDTGRLRSSIQYVNVGLMKSMANTDVSYSRPVEFGHVTRNHSSYVGPRPFMRPAFTQAKKELLDNLKAMTF